VFYDYAERERPSMEIMSELRADVADIAGAEIRVEKQEEGPPAGAPVTVRIFGEDFKTLERLSGQAQRMIAGVPNVVNLRSDLEATRPELAFTVNRRVAMLLGVNTAIVGNFLKMAIFGSKVGTYRQFNDEYDITVRLPLAKRVNIDDLYRLQIPNAAGEAVPLSSLGTFEYRGGFGTISRIDQKRVVTLTGDTEGRLSSEVLADVQRRLRPLGDPRLSERDILDWSALRHTLLEARSRTSPGPAQRIWQALPPQKGLLSFMSPSTEEVFAEALGSALNDSTKKQIRTLLNQALANPAFYSAEGFSNANLSQDAAQLLERGFDNLTEEEVQFVNRELLVSAWPDLIAPNVRLELPPNYEIRYAGEKEEEEKAQAFLSKAFGIAILLVVMVLVIQFNSLVIPLIIMTTVILSLIGALTGLLICDLPFGIIMSGIGVISLAGVVVNNAIVLLAYTRQLQAEGKDLLDAAAEAGVTRLRPVLLTAATTIIGLIPMAIGISFDVHTFSWATRSESTQWWRNMAVVVIFGLGFATMLTLVVVPSLYVMLSRFFMRLGFKGVTKATDAAPDTGPALPAPTR
jgi:multidrug efflux pump subunit AcrB